MNITLRLAFGNYAREITGVIVFNIRVSALGKMATAPLTREEINMHVFFPYVREHTNCKWTHTHTDTYNDDLRFWQTTLLHPPSLEDERERGWRPGLRSESAGQYRMGSKFVYSVNAFAENHLGEG